MIKPLYDRVLVEPAEAVSVTKGGIHLPDTAKEKPAKGTVLATGPGRLLENGHLRAVAVEVGNSVLYERYAGSEVEIDGKKLMIVRESDIVAILS
jgi:chaperonin GroES